MDQEVVATDVTVTIKDAQGRACLREGWGPWYSDRGRLLRSKHPACWMASYGIAPDSADIVGKAMMLEHLYPLNKWGCRATIGMLVDVEEGEALDDARLRAVLLLEQAGLALAVDPTHEEKPEDRT